jgi:hypothetical protein
MALSNIFNEPRREITETAIGAAIAAAFFAGLYVWGSHEYANGDRLCLPGCDSRAAYLAVFMILLTIGFVVGGVIIAGIAIGIHALGESICNRLEDAGLHLRPRQR